jgi:hypothetical protein
MRGKMLADSSIVKLFAVVSLKSDEWQLELCQYVSMEV